MNVRRTLPQRGRPTIGAWCFADHYGPDDVATSGGMVVPPHPHTGLQTVSWLFEGEIEHRDSVGQPRARATRRAQPHDRRAAASRTPRCRPRRRRACTACSCGSRCPRHPATRHRSSSMPRPRRCRSATRPFACSSARFPGWMRAPTSPCSRRSWAPSSTCRRAARRAGARSVVRARRARRRRPGRDRGRGSGGPDRGPLVAPRLPRARADAARAARRARPPHGCCSSAASRSASHRHVVELHRSQPRRDRRVPATVAGRRHRARQPDGRFGTVEGYDGEPLPAPELPTVRLKPRT